jgi:hypothetical protein
MKKVETLEYDTKTGYLKENINYNVYTFTASQFFVTKMPELPEIFNFSLQRSSLCQKHKHLSPFGKGLVVIAVTSLKIL